MLSPPQKTTSPAAELGLPKCLFATPTGAPGLRFPEGLAANHVRTPLGSEPNPQTQFVMRRDIPRSSAPNARCVCCRGCGSGGRGCLQGPAVSPPSPSLRARLGLRQEGLEPRARTPGSRRPASQARRSLTLGGAADPAPATWLGPRQPALWEGRTEAFRTPQSCEETKGLRPRFCLESHLRTWRQPRQVGGLSERTPLPRGLGDTGAYPWGQRCLSSGSGCRARGENCGLSLSALKWR